MNKPCKYLNEEGKCELRIKLCPDATFVHKCCYGDHAQNCPDYKTKRALGGFVKPK